MSPANRALPVSKPGGPLLNGHGPPGGAGMSKRCSVAKAGTENGVMRIDLWHWSIAPPQGDLPELSNAFGDVLDRLELERAGRLLDPREGYRFAMARRGVRIILGQETKCAPHDIRFELGEYGKPDLKVRHEAQGGGVAFSLSHSGDLAVLAVSRDGIVGVDVERVRDVDPAIARRFFAPREADAISGAEDQPQMLAAFFRIWTAKEAVVKATGEGIRRGLDTFEFSSLRDDEAGVVASRPGGLPPPDARVRWFLPADGYVGAMAGLETGGPIEARLIAFNG